MITFVLDGVHLRRHGMGDTQPAVRVRGDPLAEPVGLSHHRLQFGQAELRRPRRCALGHAIS
jgi:hypothetical protein